MVELANVWLDVEEGRPIQDVRSANLQDVTPDRFQLNNGDSYGIWPVEVAYGKDPVLFLAIEKGLLEEGAARRSMEVVEKDDVGERFQVL